MDTSKDEFKMQKITFTFMVNLKQKCQCQNVAEYPQRK